MTILKSWQRASKDRVDTLEITAEKVYLACDEGDDGDSAVGCRREEFLAGRLNALVGEIFGEDVLAEALDYVSRHH